MPAPEPEVTVFADADEVAGQVADRLLEALVTVQQQGRVPAISLTGGSIADKLHREVARLSPGSPVDWSRVDLWWGDERFVPTDSGERNAQQAREALLDAVPVDPQRVHEMPAADGASDLEAAATAYADELKEHGGTFDVMILGVGPDGHVASLFPGRPELDVADRLTVPVRSSPKPPPERVSLTFPALCRAREVWFIVAGSGKAGAVASALAGSPDVHLTPAAGVHGQQATRWFLDAEAARDL